MDLKGSLIFSISNLVDSRIVKLDVETGELIQLTNNSNYCSSPLWSPNGKHIAYLVSDENNQNVLWVMNELGSNKLCVSSGVDVQYLSWSKDGSEIVYSASHENLENLEFFKYQFDENLFGCYSEDEDDDVPGPIDYKINKTSKKLEILSEIRKAICRKNQSDVKAFLLKYVSSKSKKNFISSLDFKFAENFEFKPNEDAEVFNEETSHRTVTCHDLILKKCYKRDEKAIIKKTFYSPGSSRTEWTETVFMYEEASRKSRVPALLGKGAFFLGLGVSGYFSTHLVFASINSNVTAKTKNELASSSSDVEHASHNEIEPTVVFSKELSAEISREKSNALNDIKPVNVAIKQELAVEQVLAKHLPVDSKNHSKATNNLESVSTEYLSVKYIESKPIVVKEVGVTLPETNPKLITATLEKNAIVPLKEQIVTTKINKAVPVSSTANLILSPVKKEKANPKPNSYGFKTYTLPKAKAVKSQNIEVKPVQARGHVVTKSEPQDRVEPVQAKVEVITQPDIYLQNPDDPLSSKKLKYSTINQARQALESGALNKVAYSATVSKLKSDYKAEVLRARAAYEGSRISKADYKNIKRSLKLKLIGIEEDDEE